MSGDYLLQAAIGRFSSNDRQRGWRDRRRATHARAAGDECRDSAANQGSRCFDGGRKHVWGIAGTVGDGEATVQQVSAELWLRFFAGEVDYRGYAGLVQRTKGSKTRGVAEPELPWRDLAPVSPAFAAR